MQFTTLAILFASFPAMCLAAPANNQIEKRQTYIITCIGGQCNDGSTPVPSAIPKPTAIPTHKPYPPHEPYPPKHSTKVKSTPEPSKTTIQTTVKPTKTGSLGTGPSSTACPVPFYYQCGGYWDGKPWTGCTKCVKGAKCVVQNEFYDQCVADED